MPRIMARVATRGPVGVRLGSGALALALLVAGLVSAPAAEAAIVRSFGLRFSTNTTGDIVLTGNAVTTCPASSSACTDAQQATGPSANRVNNSYGMVYVDVDSVASTFNSSSADLSLPGGSRVLFAGLYWAGDTKKPAGGTNPDNKNKKNRVSLDSPVATTGYVEVTGTVVDADPNNAGAGDTDAYQAFADVTSIVAGAGNGPTWWPTSRGPSVPTAGRDGRWWWPTRTPATPAAT